MVHLMEIGLAHLLLTAPDSAGLLLVVNEHVNVFAKLRMTQAAFDSISETRSVVVAAGNTSYGPAFVGVIDIGVENTRGERQYVQFALNPQDAQQRAMIHRFTQEQALTLRGFDPTLAQLGVKTFGMSSIARAAVQAAAQALEGMTAAQADPGAAAKLPAGVTPFVAAALTIARRLKQYLAE